ncbi:MAG: hypothetical protein EOO44_13555 [Flavobacterium sp.]|nr:MAG: hypothetical protein EOO44_13555 [Flavobacterium sp.]
MKKIIFLSLLFFFNYSAFAQSSDIWVSFPNKDTTLIGFKDKNNVIKIEPKFMGFTMAQKFENIIAVYEEINDKWKSYYLTKSGKIVGQDSLYIFDNGPDCENEGFIRFKDYKTDKMGFFNQEGKIVIPAEYSDVTRITNGMFIGLKGAKKQIDGEHFFWTGGQEYLVDATNKILIENFINNNDLNFYSVEKSKQASKDPIRDSFRSVNGDYYSFINYEKEFKLWLKDLLSKEISTQSLIQVSMDNFTYWKEPKGWITSPKNTFINDNFNLIKKKLEELKSPTCDYFVSGDNLNQFIYEGKEYERYFDNCHQSKSWIYPVKDVVISHKSKKDFYQDHFEFLRTENGYRLINVYFKKEELK